MIMIPRCTPNPLFRDSSLLPVVENDHASSFIPLVNWYLGRPQGLVHCIYRGHPVISQAMARSAQFAHLTYLTHPLACQLATRVGSQMKTLRLSSPRGAGFKARSSALSPTGSPSRSILCPSTSSHAKEAVSSSRNGCPSWFTSLSHSSSALSS